MKKLKQIPLFKSAQDEQRFWDTHDLTEYFDMTKPTLVLFPNLKLSTETISLRLPAHLLSEVKSLANKRDVPYQSLMKIFLAEKVEEARGYGKGAI